MKIQTNNITIEFVNQNSCNIQGISDKIYLEPLELIKLLYAVQAAYQVELFNNR